MNRDQWYAAGAVLIGGSIGSLIAGGPNGDVLWALGCACFFCGYYEGKQYHRLACKRIKD